MATDGSKEATVALRSAIRLLKTADLQVELLCVMPSFPTSSSPPGLRQFREAYAHRIGLQAQRILERERATLCAEGVEAQLVSKTGSPARVIADMAEDYDLTVIGAGGRDARRHSGLGPVASLVVTHISGALFIGRPMRADRGPRILVTLDGSDASLEALEALTSLFDLDSAEVTLMHVMESPWLRLGPEDERIEETSTSDDEEPAFKKEMRREAQQWIDRARNELLAQHPAVNTMVEQGNPANELLSEAERGEYDLLVVGGTGASDLKHKIVGSVSAKLAWDAPCSVLLVTSAP
jgi:nucleotide-binding universal stress UspA family protein